MKAKDNPFNSSRILDVRFRPQNFRWEEFLARLESFNYRAAVIGSEGSGKTTLLDDLEQRLVALGFSVKRLRLSREEKAFPKGFQRKFFSALTKSDVVMLDGSEQLSRLEWSFFKYRAKKAGGLIITSHRKGMLPTLVELSTNEELLENIAGQLLKACPVDLPVTTKGLFSKHGGNLRLALFDLYDICAEGKYNR